MSSHLERIARQALGPESRPPRIHARIQKLSWSRIVPSRVCRRCAPPNRCRRTDSRLEEASFLLGILGALVPEQLRS